MKQLPPEGVDRLYQKSGYIHPIISSKGDTLQNSTSDHYHHYGVWGPWTRTRIDDTGVDFEFERRAGTVLFKSFKNIDWRTVMEVLLHTKNINSDTKKRASVGTQRKSNGQGMETHPINIS